MRGAASGLAFVPLSLVALAAGCGGGTSAAPDLGPLQCSLTVASKPAYATGAPLVPGTKVQLYLVDRGAPESGRGGDVRWTVSGGALETVTGHQVTWVLPTKGGDFQPIDLMVTAQTEGLANCPDAPYTMSVQAAWPENLRVLVLYNPMVQGSEDVARKYATFRGIADDHLCGVASDPVTVTAGAYPDYAKAVSDCVDAIGSWIAYIVPVYGVPYLVENRVVDTFSGKMPAPGVTSSLDALLALGKQGPDTNKPFDSPFYVKYDPTSGGFPDPYPWGSLKTVAQRDLFFVTRIDGADAKAASDLIDRTMAAEALAQSGKLAGTVYVDGKLGPNHPASPTPNTDAWGEATIVSVETLFTQLGTNMVVADYNLEEIGFPPAPLTAFNALYYAGWGVSRNNYNDVFDWNPGAIGGHLDSCSACDLRGNTSWAARALGKGITATFGVVGTGYVTGHPNYGEFFGLLTNGARFGEAAYESTPTAGWMTVFIGDPLYRPYPPQ